MTLVDTSVWIDHFRSGDAILVALLDQGTVLTHPVVIGELALGRLPKPDQILTDLLDLPAATPADDDEVLLLIRENGLSGSGIGYCDAHLLASTRLTVGATLWTRDRQLLAAARRLGLSAEIERSTGLRE